MSTHLVNYFAINWWAWGLLGADELNANTGRSYRYWRAVVLNLLVTAVFPPMLAMVMFSFEQPLDNLLNFNLTLTSFATSAKFMIYVKQLQKVIEIEQILAELDTHVNTDDQRVCHGRMVRVLSIMMRFYKLIYGLIGIASNGAFMFRGERTLPIPAWFPGNWNESIPIYIVAVLHQFLAIAMQIMQNFADDVFPPLVLVLIAGQCEMLIIRISLIGYDSSDQRTNERKLINCIQDQHRIYRMHELTMDIISWSLLVQFVVISIDVGAALCAYFFYVKDMQDRAYYISFIIGLAMQIFPVCYYGTLVEYGFERLHSAVYSSNWVDQSMAYRRNAIIFSQRTQRLPKQLAGNFMPIALTTFLANCKAAYSFCTLLADTRSDN